MFSIILTDGKIININADKVCWNEKTRTITLMKGQQQTVARINMDNVVGWIETDDIVEIKETQSNINGNESWNESRIWSTMDALLGQTPQKRQDEIKATKESD